MIVSISEVYEKIKSLPPKRVAVVQAANGHVLQAVISAYKEGYVIPILIGDTECIHAAAAAEGFDITPFELIQAENDIEAVTCATKLVHEGRADVVMKGMLNSAPFMKGILNREHGLRKEHATVSITAVAELKRLGRLIFITDPGIITAPTLEQKKAILLNAVEIAQSFGIETPVVGVLSAIENVNPAIPSSVDAAELTEMCRRGELGNCQVIGPVSLDIALSEEAAEEKGYRIPGAGKADIILVHSLDVGNVLYKSLMLFADMDTGGIVTGTTVPIVSSSRADSPRTKMNALAFAVYMANKQTEH